MNRVEFGFSRLERGGYDQPMPQFVTSAKQVSQSRLDDCPMVLLLPLPAVAWLDPASVLAGVVIGLALGLAAGMLTRGRRAV
jgi:hypothetical protein